MSKRMSYDLEKFWDAGRPPEWADSLMSDLHRQRHWLTTLETERVALAIVDGLTQLFPDRVEIWRTCYPFAFQGAEDVRRRTDEKSDGRPGWNDYHMCRWFISHDRSEVVAMVNRIAYPDVDVAGSCIWMLTSVCVQFPELLGQLREVVFSDDLLPELHDWIRPRFDEILGASAVSRKAQAQREYLAVQN